MKYSAKGLAYTSLLYLVAIRMIVSELISINNKKTLAQEASCGYLPQITYKVTGTS